MKRFDNKTVIVTGGNSGIGRATALRFAEEGAQVAIIARNAGSGHQVVDEIRSKGGEAAFFQADVGVADDVQRAMQGVVGRYGSFQAAFNCAGMTGDPMPLDQVSDAEFDRVIKTNLYGVFYCTRHEVSHFLANGGGVIVNCSSVAGIVGVPVLAAYNASKHAVIGFSKSAALDYAARGIRVNSLCPGGVVTTMLREYVEHNPAYLDQLHAAHPMSRLADAKEVTGLVLWLCSDEASFVTGQSYVVDGGYTVR